MTKQQKLYLALGAIALMVYLALVDRVRTSDPGWAVADVLFVSPVLIALIAMESEGRKLRGLFDLKHGSWAFLLGDTFALTGAVVVATHAHHAAPQTGWFASHWWTATCLLIGFLGGAAFHRMDAGAYRKVGAGNRLKSPTKITHDFVTYPVLLGALVCVGVPLLVNWSSYTWAFLGCLGLWGILCICDMVRGLDPKKLHPGWDADAFEVIPDPVPLPAA